MTLKITGVILKEFYAVASFLYYLTQKYYLFLSLVLRRRLEKLISCSTDLVMIIYQVVAWTEKNPVKSMRKIIQKLVQTAYPKISSNSNCKQ